MIVNAVKFRGQPGGVVELQQVEDGPWLRMYPREGEVFEWGCVGEGAESLAEAILRRAGAQPWEMPVLTGSFVGLVVSRLRPVWTIDGQAVQVALATLRAQLAAGVSA